MLINTYSHVITKTKIKIISSPSQISHAYLSLTIPKAPGNSDMFFVPIVLPSQNVRAESPHDIK